MLLAINMENFYNALYLMAQGMAGIFITILIIMLVIWAIPQLTRNIQKGGEE